MANRLPSLNGLRAFEAAARHLSFTKAAAELHVTQTAVSHQIRRLEEQLGLELFRRDGRGLRLSEAGRDYLPAVAAAFEDLRRATQKLRRGNDEGRLTVSTTGSFAVKWLVPKLGKFQARHPEIEVRVSSSIRLVDFERDDVDCAIRFGMGEWPGLIADWLLTEDMFPVCSPKLLSGPIPLTKPEDLALHTLIHISQAPDDWRQWLTASGLPDLKGAHDLEFDLSLMALAAAVDGLGVALGRSTIAGDDLAAGRLVQPFALTLRADAGYYFVTPKGSEKRPKIAAFRDWLLHEVRAGRAS